MEILWDEPKRQANLVKHGLDFADFAEGFSWDRFLADRTRSGRDGRSRYRYLGLMTGRVVLAIVSPLDSEGLALISVRPANAKERRRYEEASPHFPG